ncbi:hypothetical protein PCAR4_860027 [Paraburkholderia caribensis]|nr:hypothetical protein PCAR4_860027 [Paraburkholderia caribensis]
MAPPLPQTKSTTDTRSTIRFPPEARAKPKPAAPGKYQQHPKPKPIHPTPSTVTRTANPTQA